MKTLLSTALVACLCLPSWSQAASENEGQSRRPKGPDIEFLDSTEAYWVNKSFNDTLFYGAGGSVNSVRKERDQFRNDEALRKIYKPTKIVEITVSGNPQTTPMPRLRMDGKEAPSRPSNP